MLGIHYQIVATSFHFVLHDRIHIIHAIDNFEARDADEDDNDGGGGGNGDDDAPTIIQSRIDHILITYSFFYFTLLVFRFFSGAIAHVLGTATPAFVSVCSASDQ